VVSLRWKIVLSILVAVGVCVWVWTPRPLDPEAFRLMARAAQALEEVPVSGMIETKVWFRGEQREARAKVQRGAGRVHIEYLSGPTAKAEVFKQGQMVWACGRGEGKQRAESFSQPGWRSELVSQNYRARILGSREVAGRTVDLVRGSGSWGNLLLGVDRDTGFPLLMERYAPDGRLVAATVYREAKFGGQPPQERKPPAILAAQPPELGPPMTAEELQRRAGFSILLPSYLPKGFEFQGYYLRQRPRWDLAEIHYTDGLRVLLVIERQVPGQGRGGGPGYGRGRDGRGPMMQLRGLHGDGVRRVLGDTLVIVLGSLPARQLGRIADSLQPLR